MSTDAAGRIPGTYLAASCRNVTPVDITTDEIGIGFVLADGQVLRLRLSACDAAGLATSLTSYLDAFEARSHSVTSSGMPSVEVSTPDEWLNVCPPDKSSAACRGLT